MNLFFHAVVVSLSLEALPAQERVWEADLIHNLSEHLGLHLRALGSPRKLSLSEARHAQELRHSTHEELRLLMAASDEIRVARREMLNQDMARLYRHVKNDVLRRRWETLRTVFLKEVPAHLMAVETLWREGAKEWAAHVPPRRRNARDFPHLFRDAGGQFVEYVAPVIGYEDYIEFRAFAERLRGEWRWMSQFNREMAAVREEVQKNWKK